MKFITCRDCDKRFAVADLGRHRISQAEAEGECGTCWWKKHDIYDFKKLYAQTLIVVYSLKNCSRCDVLKAALKDAGIAFIELSLNETNVRADLVMNNITLSSAPAIQVGGLVFEYKGNMKK